MSASRAVGTDAELHRILAATPAAGRVVLVDPRGRLAAVAGGAVAPDAGPAVMRLWEDATRAARTRSPSALDHVVARTTVGGLVVVRCRDGLLAAVCRTDSRPDRLAYELRRAAAGLSLPPATAEGEA
ncbi:MAG: hypothetical protein FJ000_00825 [Actinobacteria bacterium]|nr:hypothetical protein [Actinomycetota bacterium]